MLQSYIYSSLFCQCGQNNLEKVLVSCLAIRIAKPKDINEITEVLMVSFHPPRQFWRWFYPLIRLGIYEDLRSRLRSASPHYQCLVAYRSFKTNQATLEEIIGTVELSLRSGLSRSSPGLYLANLAVNPEYRRQGVGRLLLTKCEQIAGEWGFQKVFLHVLEDNESAKRLYFSIGYQLERTEFSLESWLFRKPKRLLLGKRINPSVLSEQRL